MSATDEHVWQEAATFATDVYPCGQPLALDGLLGLLDEAGGPCDVIVLAVPAGEGVTFEAVIHRCLGTEPSGRKQPSESGC